MVRLTSPAASTAAGTPRRVALSRTSLTMRAITRIGEGADAIWSRRLAAVSTRRLRRIIAGSAGFSTADVSWATSPHPPASVLSMFYYTFGGAPDIWPLPQRNFSRGSHRYG